MEKSWLKNRHLMMSVCRSLAIICICASNLLLFGEFVLRFQWSDLRLASGDALSIVPSLLRLTIVLLLAAIAFLEMVRDLDSRQQIEQDLEMQDL